MTRLESYVKALASRGTPVAALPSPGVRVGRLAAIFAILGVAFFLVRGLRMDFAVQAGRPSFWIETFLLAGLSLLSCWATVALSLPASLGHGFWQWGWIVGATTWMGVFLGSFLVPAWSLDAFSLTTAPGWGCAVELGLAALPAAGLLVWEARRGFVTNPWTTAVQVAAGALTLGLLVLQLSCSNGDFAHVLFWHIAPFLGLGFSGALLFRKWVIADGGSSLRGGIANGPREE